MSKESIRIVFTGAQASGKTKLMNQIKEKCSDAFELAIPDSSGFDHEMTAVMRDIKPQPKLRVWHIPQVPGEAFHVEVASVEEGAKLMDVLGDYDQFQFDHNIKGDYCNVNGLQIWDESLTDQDLIDMELDDRWVDWYYEDENESFDDIKDYLDWKASKA